VAASIGDDGQPIAFGHGHAGEDLKEVEQLVYGVHTDDVGLVERCIVDLVASGESPGVRRGRLGAGAGPSRLENDDGLYLAGPERLPHKLLPAVGPLDVHTYDVGVGVVLEIAQQVRLIDVDLVADADELGEPHLGLGRPVQHGAAHRSRLGGDGDGAGHGVDVGKGDVHPLMGVHDAHAVRAEHTHAVLLGDVPHLALQQRPLLPQLLEPGGDDDDGLGPLDARLLHDRGDERVGNAYHDQLHLSRHCGQRGVGLAAKDLTGLGIDGVHCSLEVGSDEITEDDMPDLSLVVRCTDHRNKFWLEEGFHLDRPINVYKFLCETPEV